MKEKIARITWLLELLADCGVHYVTIDETGTYPSSVYLHNVKHAEAADEGFNVEFERNVGSSNFWKFSEGNVTFHINENEEDY